MSWLYSRVLVEEYLEEAYSDGEQSAPSSESRTPQAYLPSDKMTEFSRPSRFGMTFAPLTEDLGAGLLTWYLEDSLAKTYQSPVEVQELKASGQGFGERCCVSFVKYSHDTSTWRTAQPSLIEGWDVYSETWPRRGTMQNGECWDLPMWGRHTKGTEYGLWPTPTASQARSEGQIIAMRKKVEAGETTVAEAEAMIQGSLTPKRMKTWPTPTAHNAKETNAPSEANRNTPTLASQAGGHLNPTWVEWLMGWPLGWTDLKPLEMDKFQEWLLKHSAD